MAVCLERRIVLVETEDGNELIQPETAAL